METIARRGDVISVGAAGSIAVDVSAPDEGVRAVNPGQPPVGIVHILPGYFEAAGIALRRGHLPDWSDVRGAADASVIGESAARILFPGRHPIGETFANARGRQFIVVGVVADVRKNPQQEAPALTYAIPADATRRLTLVVRISGRQDAAKTEIRREISALAPGALVSTEWWSDTMDAWVAYRNPRFQTLVFASLASLADASG